MSAQPSVAAPPAHPDDAIPPELRPFCKRGLAQYRKVLRYVHREISFRSRDETKAFLAVVNLPGDAEAPERLDMILKYAPKRQCGACGDWYLETEPGRFRGHCGDACRRSFGNNRTRRADDCVLCGRPVGRGRQRYCGAGCAREGYLRIKADRWRAAHPAVSAEEAERRYLARRAAAADRALCRGCGASMAGRKADAVYCSPRCKDLVRWAARREARAREARPPCRVCGRPVPRPRRSCCSDECYRRDDNRRRNEQRAAAR